MSCLRFYRRRGLFLYFDILVCHTMTLNSSSLRFKMKMGLFDSSNLLFVHLKTCVFFKQEEHLAKGVRDMKQRHIASFLTAIEKGVSKKLRDKDLELENMNRKNRELIERIKQVAMEAQNWHYRAKYNESVVNVLKTNLQQAISQGADQGKEGFGDSEDDDAASYIDPNNFLSIPGGALKSFPKNYAGSKEHHMSCRACKKKEVSILLMPCRHLCLCKECDGLTSVCPVCQSMKTGSVQVYLS